MHKGVAAQDDGNQSCTYVILNWPFLGVGLTWNSGSEKEVCLPKSPSQKYLSGWWDGARNQIDNGLQRCCLFMPFPVLITSGQKSSCGISQMVIDLIERHLCWGSSRKSPEVWRWWPLWSPVLPRTVDDSDKTELYAALAFQYHFLSKGDPDYF